MKLDFEIVEWAYERPFRISYSTKSLIGTVVVSLEENGLVGRGEGVPIAYKGETVDTIVAELGRVRRAIEAGAMRLDLTRLMPPSAARNALDCAFWDLESKRGGRRAWELACVPELRPITTDFTIGIDTPAAMADIARAASSMLDFKLKLGDAGDLARVEAVRAARPDAGLIIDANQGWSFDQLVALLPRLHELRVRLIEQPLPVGHDAPLAGFRSPVPICADESCQTVESIPELIGKYAYVNIKLDKTGGLSAALALADAAQAAQFGLMVGCMGGSSLAMAPAMIIAQRCDFVDLDGPLLLTADREAPITYDGGRMSLPDAALWG
jgi:L-Ala-D/L-Glu epimerase